MPAIAATIASSTNYPANHSKTEKTDQRSFRSMKKEPLCRLTQSLSQPRSCQARKRSGFRARQSGMIDCCPIQQCLQPRWRTQIIPSSTSCLFRALRPESATYGDISGSLRAYCMPSIKSASPGRTGGRTGQGRFWTIAQRRHSTGASKSGHPAALIVVCKLRVPTSSSPTFPVHRPSTAPAGDDDRPVHPEPVTPALNQVAGIRALDRRERIDAITVRYLTPANRSQQRAWLGLFDDPDLHAPEATSSRHG